MNWLKKRLPRNSDSKPDASAGSGNAPRVISASRKKIAAIILSFVLVATGTTAAFSVISDANAATTITKGAKIRDIVPSQTLVLDKDLNAANLSSWSCSNSNVVKANRIINEGGYDFYYKVTLTDKQKYTPSGDLTLRWNNVGFDSTGTRVDAVITVHPVYLQECAEHATTCKNPVLAVVSPTGFALSARSHNADTDTYKPRVALVADVTLTLYKTGTSTAASGTFVSKIYDIDATCGTEYTSEDLDESVKFQSNVSNVYMQTNSIMKVSDNNTRFTGTAQHVSDTWETAIAYTTGYTHKVRFYGSRCSTGLFEQFSTYKITASSGSGGSISYPGSTVVGWKGSKSYTMTPSTGYTVKDVKVNGTSVGKVTSYSFSNVTSNQTISVEWRSLGSVAIQKSSADTSISVTDRYSLSGAVYTLYSNSACTTLAKDAYNNNVTLTTNASGYAKSSNVLNDGTYYLKETKAPKGYRLDTSVKTITISNGTAASATSSEAPQRGTLKVVKKSAAPSITDGNSCYSLAGAVYKVYRGSTEVATLTTGSNGETNTVTLPLGAYTVKETKASPGYRLDATTHSVDISTDNQAASVSSLEPPLLDDYPLAIRKVDTDMYRDGKGTGAQGGMTMAGAKFRTSYYKGHYSNVESLPASATWTKELQTSAADSNGRWVATVPTSEMYSDGAGKTGWPMGTYKIEEIEAPFGYDTDKSVYLMQVKQDGDAAQSDTIVGENEKSGTARIAADNAVVVKDKTKNGDLAVMKFGETAIDEDTQEEKKTPQEGVAFDIINNNENPVYRVTDGTWAAPGEVVCRIVTDDEGWASTRDLALDAGARNALPMGSYIVHEDPMTTIAGYAPMPDRTLTVSTPNKETHWIIENKIGTPIKLVKRDSETEKVVPGSATFAIYDENGDRVSFTDRYPEEITQDEFTTVADGSVVLPSKMMPGNYTLREVHAPYGYLVSDESAPFTIDSSTVGTWNDKLEVSFHDDPAKGKIRIGNIDMETEKTIHAAASFKVIADEDITTPDGTVRVPKDTVVFEGETDGDQLVTDELYLGLYRVEQVTAPNGYILNAEPYTVELVYENDTTPIVYSDVAFPNTPQKGAIELTLNDRETNLPITASRAIYELVAYGDVITPDGTVRHADGDIIETLTTDESGKLSSEEPHYIGNYVLREISAPDGYVLDDADVPVSVEYAGQDKESCNTASTYHSNMPQKGHVSIEKRDLETNKVVPLSGAQFVIIAVGDIITGDGTVRYADGEEVCLIETDENGTAITGEPLYLGTYRVEEIRAPYGYKLGGEPAEVELTYAGQESDLTESGVLSGAFIADEPAKGTVHIQKKDSETGNPIPEADILISIIAAEDITTPDGTVRYKAGEAVIDMFTDESGIATAGELYPGSYKAIEQTAPNGYVVNPDPKEFEIVCEDDGNGTVPDTDTSIADNPAKGTIDLTNVDRDTVLPINRVPSTFIVYAAEDISTPDGTLRYKSGEQVFEGDTENGTLSTPELYLGTYIVVQSEAPYGYIINSESQEVTLTYANDQVPVVHTPASIANTPQTGSVSVITKDAETNLPILEPKSVYEVIAAHDIATGDGTIRAVAGDIVCMIETDETGKAISAPDFHIGKYFLVQKQASDGYVLNRESVPVEITYAGQDEPTANEGASEHPNMPQKGHISFVKNDAETGKTVPVSDGIFDIVATEDIITGDGTIRYKAGETVETVRTDMTGTATTGTPHYLGNYKIVEKKAPYGYKTTSEEVPVALSYAGQDLELTESGMIDISVSDLPAKGTMHLQKKDSESARAIPAADIRIAVYAAEDIMTPEGTIRYHKDERIGTILTDMNGIATQENLYPGEYRAVEETAPFGYVVNPDPVPFVVELDSDGNNVPDTDISISDDPTKGIIELENVDFDTEKPIMNESQFTITAAEDIYTEDGTIRYKAGETVFTGKTENGKLETPELYLGSYIVNQTDAPDGYVINRNPSEISLNYTDDRTPVVRTPLSFKNAAQTGSVSVVVKDEETDKPITTPKAVYEVRASEDIVTGDGTVRATAGALVGEIETDETGKAISAPDLYIGKYILIQKEASDGYVLNTESVPVEITYAGQNSANANEGASEHSNMPQKGHIAVVKKDEETGKIVPVPHAIFDVYAATDIVTGDGTVRHSEGDLVDTIRTDEMGTASTKTPHYLGTYKIVETKAPEGYKIGEQNETQATLSYAGPGNELTESALSGVEISDPAAKGSITVHKTDSGTGLPLKEQGIQIEIIANKDIITPDGTVRLHAGESAGITETDENGNAVMEGLYIGEYRAVERTAPTGYLVSEDQPVFEIGLPNDDGSDFSTELTISDEPVLGTATLSTTDIETEKTLSHSPAVFRIIAAEDIITVDGTKRASKDDIVDEVTMDNEDGTVDTKPLFPGKYLVEQVKSPLGYIAGDPIEITISPDPDENSKQSTTSGKIADTVKKAVIQIQNKDVESGLALTSAGVTFDIISVEDILRPDGTLEYEKGTVVQTIETDDTGKASSEPIVLGKYEVRETMPSDGYLLNPIAIKAEASYADGDSSFEIVAPMSVAHMGEMPRGHLTVKKIDGDTEEPLAGAKFALTAINDIVSGDGVVHAKAGEVVATAETDENGIAVFSEIRQGLYNVVETEAPAGYITDKSERQIEFSYTHDNENPEAPISDLSYLESNADKNKETEEEAKTGNDNDITSKNDTEATDESGEPQPQNTDEQEEAAAADNNDDASAVTATDSTAPVSNPDYVPRVLDTIERAITIANSAVKVKIAKINIDDEPVAGCSLTLNKYNGDMPAEGQKPDKNLYGEEADTWETGNEAHEVRAIEPGLYVITENSAADGYAVSDPKVIAVEEKADNETSFVNFHEEAVADELIALGEKEAAEKIVEEPNPMGQLGDLILPFLAIGMIAAGAVIVIMTIVRRRR